MAKPLVPDDLWAAIAPLLPIEPPKPKGGRPRLSDRAALTGILFVLKSGLPWEMLPAEMGCGSGMSCWRRLRDWHEAGVWAALHRVLLERLHRAGEIDWRRAALDSASVPAKRGEPRRVRTQRIVGDRAASATLRLMREARRSAC
jgi:transposase